ncbi:MAG: hypothetical protein ACAI44_15210 [Candidatus Sericytochromatia bacterium]
MNSPVKLFDKEQILLVHKQLVDRFGGSHGVHSANMLDSTIGSISASCQDIIVMAMAIATGTMHEDETIDWFNRHVHWPES